MKIMYVAPRYHTNQIDAVAGWLEHGDEVKFISYYTSTIEDYSLLKPIVLGFSPVYEWFDKIYMNLHRGNIYAGGFKINHGIPPILKFRRIIKDWKPDVIIFRERSFYTIVGYLIARRRSKCVLYNQSPLWDAPPKTDIKHRLVYSLTPKWRYTPCMGSEEDGKVIAPNSMYIPFVVSPKVAPEAREYFKDNRINILCIGVFEPRKNHMLLMDAIHGIKDKVHRDIHLTIVGEAVEQEQKEFLKIVNTHMIELGMQGMTDIKTNLSRGELSELYSTTDIFVIPSTREPASISQLEAMSYSEPAICADANGSANYVIDGYNGYQFKDNDQTDLEDKLLKIMVSDENIMAIGANAYQSIVKNNSFKEYYEGICQIINSK